MDGDAAVHGRQPDRWPGIAETKHLVAVVPGALGSIADVAPARNGNMLGTGDLQRGGKVSRDRDAHTAVVSVSFHTFSVPLFRQSNGQTAILHVGAHVSAAVLNGYAAILRFNVDRSTALVQRYAAVRGACLRGSGKFTKRDATVVGAQADRRITRRPDQQQRSQDKVVRKFNRESKNELAKS